MLKDVKTLKINENNDKIICHLRKLLYLCCNKQSKIKKSEIMKSRSSLKTTNRTETNEWLKRKNTESEVSDRLDELNRELSTLGNLRNLSLSNDDEKESDRLDKEMENLELEKKELWKLM